jgi:hypothetical protein
LKEMGITGSSVFCGWQRRSAKGEESVMCDLCNFLLCNFLLEHKCCMNL